MAQRQFRSDDTDKWPYGFGDGSSGNLNQTTATDAPIDSACTGTAGANSLSATNVSFAAGQIVMIDQTKDSGGTADSNPSWELNKIQSYSAGTITLEKPLTRNYVSGAQVLVIPQYDVYNLNGATLTAKAWTGTVGGILAIFAKTSISGTGTLALNEKGFRGGIGDNTDGGKGEGHLGGDLVTGGAAANANGGGAVNAGNGGSGGGGGNGTAGGNGTGGSSNGVGGSTAGNAGLTIFSMGGGGGGGKDGSAGSGARGGGKLLLVAPSIDVSGMTVNLNGGNATGPSFAGGGGGAGGSALLKGKTVVLGTNKITATGGVKGGTGGGAGGDGRVHVDYSVSVSGTTNPTLDSRLDTSITEGGGATFLLNFV